MIEESESPPIMPGVAEPQARWPEEPAHVAPRSIQAAAFDHAMDKNAEALAELAK